MNPAILDVIVALIISMVLHEVAHGFAAKALGDETAARAGRLTLNPLKHVDPVGSILLPLVLAAGQIAAMGRIVFLYGWAKPLPVDPLRLRWRGQAHPRQLMALVALAGPLTNFALALLGGVLLHTPLPPAFLYYFIVINLVIGLFNLLPIPPFDGGRIAVGILPLPAAAVLARTEKYGILFILLVLFVIPALFRVDPFQTAIDWVLPGAVRTILLLTGHGHGG